MALQTTGTSTLSVEFYNKYYSKKLLNHAVQSLVMDQFGQQVDLPKNMGTKIIRFMRADVGDQANVQTLTEGTPIAVFRETTLSAVDATLVQYGEAIKTSDVLGWVDLFSTLEQGIRSMGEDAALHADLNIMTEVVTGAASGSKRYSGGAATFAALSALSNANGAMVIQDLLGAMTKLTINRAPKAKGGEYVAVVPPQLAYDLMLDPKFIAAGEYAAHKGLFNGEIGRWYGVRIIIATQPFRETSGGSENTYVAAGTIYTTVVTGSDAYGIPKMAGQSPFSPKVVICDKPDKSDPANQFVTAAWKAFWVCKTLNDTWAIPVRSKTTFA